MSQQENLFGGDWSKETLDRVGKYLESYTTVLKHQQFDRIYIDAFAGTGYAELKRDDDPKELLLPELTEEESIRFIDGSARTALQVKPRFTRYVFIEKSEKRLEALEKLKAEFPDLAASIIMRKEDANFYIQRICQTEKWIAQRAVIFLDPYGMQVSWETIEAVAQAPGIDLWLLFPLGVCVNRLLRRDGKIDPKIRKRLDRFFGVKDWSEAFYREEHEEDQSSSRKTTHRIATPEEIGTYFVSRLKTVFTGVSDNPLILYNSRGVPLYLLCFAASNPKAAPVALNIAQHILKTT